MYKNDYVVYFHRNPTTDAIFYVGMGNLKRPNDFVSMETRQRMSRSRIRLKLRTKKVKDNLTGIIYESMVDAGAAMGVSNKIMSAWISGKVQKTKNRFSILNERA